MKTLRTLVQIVVILLTSITIYAQTISLLVTDADDQPIQDAFVFVANTQIGATSDASGMASVNLGDIQAYSIVITHLQYKVATIDHTDIAPDAITHIRLEDNSNLLNVITVSGGKRDTKKRKQWMKKFKKAFLGKKVSPKRVKIKNPEVILFEEKGDTLYAYSSDNIEIENNELGYFQKFALESFMTTKEESTFFSGKSYIKDISKNKKKYKKRRKKIFMDSKRLFFKSLINQHPLNEKQFEYGTLAVSDDGTGTYLPLTYDDLDIRPGVWADTLYLDGYLTVFNKKRKKLSLISIDKRRKTLKQSDVSSLLYSLSGKYVISHDGYLINEQEIEESGYWAEFRMANELPMTYDGGLRIDRVDPSSSIASSLKRYRQENAAEKVYLHTDKTSYYPYEDMWFKAYLVDATTHSPSVASQVVYVDLIDDKNDKVKTWVLHTSKGLKGDMQWAPYHRRGTYTLRAYTNVMRNQSDEFFFEKEITLAETEAQASDNSSADAKDLIVNFYPEGGDLIHNVASQVAYRISTPSGKSISLKTKVVDQSGAVIAHSESRHRGMGLFQITPQNQQEYKLVAEYQDSIYEYSLPSALPDGISLGVNTNSTENLYISVAASQDEYLNGSKLIGHVRGQLVVQVNNPQPGKQIVVPKSTLPSGIIHFTLFDRHERPHAERIIFNEYDVNSSVVNLDSKVLPQSDQQFINIDLSPDSLLWQGDNVDLSISVTKNAEVDKSVARNDINGYLLLESDIDKTLPNIEEYLSKADHKVTRYHLDLLMRVCQWRRFDWRSVLSSDEPIVAPHTAEIVYRVSGQTITKKGKAPVQTAVLLNTLQPSFYMASTLTDANGYFSFDSIPLADSTLYILQAQMASELPDSPTDISPSSVIDFIIDPISPVTDVQDRQIIPASEVAEKPTITAENLTYLNQLSLRDTNIWQEQIEEISITAKRAHTSNRSTGEGRYYNLDNMDWVNPSLMGTNLINRLAPRRHYMTSSEGRLLSITTNFQGQPTYIPIQVVIDGMGAEPGGSNAINLMTLTADVIKDVFISPGGIYINTRQTRRSNVKKEKGGIVHLKHPGYYTARTFANENMEQETDYPINTTVYWNPDIQLDQDSLQLQIPLKNTSPEDDYTIKVQGISSTGEIVSQTYKRKVADSLK